MPGQTVAQMTRDELTDLLSTVVEKSLFEILGDPDEGFSVRADLLQRLESQSQAVADGERGESLNDVAKRLGLE